MRRCCVASARCQQDHEGPATAVAGEVDFGGQSSSGSAEGVIVRFVRPVGPPFRPVTAAYSVGADDRGVDLHQPVEAVGCIRAILYLLQGPGEHVVQNVAAEAGETICDEPMIFED
jgi:hypothetical protein